MMFSVGMLYPQQAVVSAGNDGSGAGGSLSFSLGQVLDISTKASGYIEWQGVQQTYINMWEGYTDTNWGSAANWLLGSVPASGEDILFDLTPYNHLVLDQNRVIDSLINTQSTYLTVINGHNLTINGSFVHSNGAQVDASATGSTVTFAGSSAQTIPSGTFYNNQAHNLAINNANNVMLYGNLNLSGALSATSGYLDGISQTPLVTYNGTSAQTIEANTWLNERLYNLTVANAAGVTDNALLTVNNNLTVNTGALFTINAAKTLNVNGTITNNAGASGFVIASNASGTGSLIHNTNNVAATVNRYIDGVATAWHFLSSPVAGQAIHGTGWTPSGTYGDGTGYDLYVWDEPTSCWIYNLNTTVAPTWTTTHSSTDFVPGRGYLYAVQATTPTKQFVGNLGNGTINYTVDASGTGIYKGFNLMGNPYPSSIDWKQNSGYTRDMLVQTGGGYDMWTWSNSANNYGVYNSADTDDEGTNNVNRYIAPMQGFFVKAGSDAGFSFNNAARSNTAAGQWSKIRQENPTTNRISLTVNSAEAVGRDEVRILYNYDKKCGGALKLFSSVAVAPSLFMPVSGNNYTTQYLTDSIDNTVIPVNFKAGKNGDYTLKISFDKASFSYIYVKDKLTGGQHDFQQSEIYTFKASVKDRPDRFMLCFGKENTPFQDNMARVYVSDRKINICIIAAEGDYKTEIFDFRGCKIFEKQLTGGETATYNPLQHAVYLVKVSTAEKIQIQKIIYTH